MRMTQETAGRLEERHDRYIDLIKQFTIMNDIFRVNHFFRGIDVTTL